MANDFFNATGAPAFRAPGASAQIKAEFAAVTTGLDKLAPLTGHPLELVRVNAGATAYESVTFATLAAAYLTIASAASTYLPLAGGTVSGTILGATSLGEVFRLRNDGAFISFYNTAAAVRTGYIQGNVGTSSLDLVGDVGKGVRIFSNTALRAEWASAGELGLNATPVGTVAFRVQSPGSNDVGLEWQRTSASVGVLLSYNRSGLAYTSLRYEAADHTFGTSGTARWTLNSGGSFVPNADNAYNVGSAGLRPATLFGVVGNFTGTVTAAAFSGPLTGNASTATTATTANALATNALDGAGNEIGYKGLPTASVTSGAFVAADRGKIVKATGGVTVPNAVMAATDVVTIYNTTGGNITITAAVGTLRLAGTASTGARTLASRGLCTVYFDSATDAVISGAGLT